MDIYTPSTDKVIHQAYVDLNKRGVSKPIHLVQYDHGLPIVEVNLYSDGYAYKLPEECYVNIRLKKPDDKVIHNPVLGCNENRDSVFFEITYQMTLYNGKIPLVLEVVIGNNVAATSVIVLEVDKNPVQPEDVVSEEQRESIIMYVDETNRHAKDAANSAANAKISESNARSYASTALDAKDNASLSETRTATSENNARTYKTHAENSATNAKTSEINANASAEKAERSEINAYNSEVNASKSETNAKTSETNAKKSETKAKTSETNAKKSEENVEKMISDFQITMQNIHEPDYNIQFSKDDWEWNYDNECYALFVVTERPVITVFRYEDPTLQDNAYCYSVDVEIESDREETNGMIILSDEPFDGFVKLAGVMF